MDDKIVLIVAGVKPCSANFTLTINTQGASFSCTKGVFPLENLERKEDCDMHSEPLKSSLSLKLTLGSMIELATFEQQSLPVRSPI